MLQAVRIMSQSIARMVCGEFWVSNRTYHSPLPKNVAPWYSYCSDGGHCIVCCLKEDYKEGIDLTNYLVPVPVKTVLKNYQVKGQYVVVDLPYSPELGVLTPAKDTEF